MDDNRSLAEAMKAIAEEMGFEHDPNDSCGGLPVIPEELRKKPGATSSKCYICNDPEFAERGLPLCRACPACGGHVAADDTRCDECGLDDYGFWQLVHMVDTRKMTFEEARDRHLAGCFVDTSGKPVGPPTDLAHGAANIALWRNVDPMGYEKDEDG